MGSDLVVAVNGHPVKASQDISNAIAPLKPGAVVKLRVVRGGKVITLNATLGTRPESAQAR